MSFIKAGISAIGKLFIVIALAGTFLVGLVGVVYLSLRGEEVKIPEVVGKDYVESEKELAALGLKVKKVAMRYSQEKPNTILEQRPIAGESGKTGLMVSVIVAQANPEGEEAPATIKKEEEQEETPTDLEIPSDKKKPNKNANVKKAQTTRDVVSDKSNKNSNSNAAADLNNTNSSGANTKTNSNKSATPVVSPKPIVPGTKTIIIPSASPKPAVSKTPATGGDIRTRRVP